MSNRLHQLQSMLDRDPADAFCAYALAMEHAKLGQTDEAVTWFDRAVTLDPSQCYAYFHKAKALDAAGRRQAAIESLTVGLREARTRQDLKAAGEIESLLDELNDS